MKFRAPFIAITITLLALSGCAEHHHQYKPPMRVMQNAHSGGSALAINSDSNTLASGGWAGKINIWNLPSGKLKSHWKAHKGSVNGIAFTDNNQTLITAGYDSKVIGWDLHGNKRFEWSGKTPIRAFSLLENDRVATGHTNGKVRLWELRTGRLIQEQRLKGSDITAVSVKPDGSRIALSDSSGRAAQWTLNDNSVKAMEGSPSYARSLAYSPDGKHIYGSGWFKLFRWTEQSGKIDLLSTEHTGIINNIKFTPSGNLATISRQTDSSVLVLNPKNGATISAMGKHELCGGYIAVAPNGCYVATNSDDASVRIWSLNPACTLPAGELIGLK